MLGIITKFIGPTNFKGSRIKAIMPSGASMYISWDHALDAEDNHRNAAIAVIKKNLATNIKFDITSGNCQKFMVHVVKYHYEN